MVSIITCLIQGGLLPGLVAEIQDRLRLLHRDGACGNNPLLSDDVLGYYVGPSILCGNSLRRVPHGLYYALVDIEKIRIVIGLAELVVLRHQLQLAQVVDASEARGLIIAVGQLFRPLLVLVAVA